MKTLKELTDEIIETEKWTKIDLEAVDRRVLPGVTCTVNDAKERIGAMKKEYFGRIAELTIGIFVLGEKAADFAKVAEEEGNTLTVNAAAMYERFATMIEPVIADSREFGITAFSRLTQGLTDVGHELDLKAMDMPKFKDGKVKTHAALVTHIRNIVRAALGDDLNRLYVSDFIQKQAYEKKFKGSAYPIVFIGLADADEAKGLEGSVAKFGTRIFTSTNQVTKEEVLEVFKAVKTRLKAKTSTPENNQ